MKKFLLGLLSAVSLMAPAAFGQSITIDSNVYVSGYGLNAAQFIASNNVAFAGCTNLVVCTNNAFAYFGLPSSNVVSAAGNSNGSWDQVPWGDQYWMRTAYAPINNVYPLPPIEVKFDFTGTNFEVLLNNSYWPGNLNGNAHEDFIITEGTNVTRRTDCPQILNNAVTYVPVTFSQNITHHLTLRLIGSFYGINIKAGESITASTLPKYNLLLVNGDSYAQGYTLDYSYGDGSQQNNWLDGWCLQLENIVTNLVVAPFGVGGTGFVSTNSGGVLNYTNSAREAELLLAYTNAYNSGLYNNIYITGLGTINDYGIPTTNALVANATAWYQHVLTNCTNARVFFIGTAANVGQDIHNFTLNSWVGPNEAMQSTVATNLGIPFISLISPAGVVNQGNIAGFYGADNAHPSVSGYKQMAAYINTNLSYIYGTNWNPYGPTNGGGSGLLSSVTVTNSTYGAKGDAVRLFFNTVSNSTLATTTNVLTAADIGKAVEIWNAGAQTYGVNSYGIQATNNQDLVTTIANVTAGTNITLATVALNTITNTYGTYGTDNYGPFTNAVAACANPAVVNIPPGTYLFIAHTDSVAKWQWHGIPINRAGITFLGANQTNTTLLAQGAWQMQVIPNGGNDGNGHTNITTRGAMFEVFAPFSATDTNPIVVQNLTLDGGVTNGLLNVQNQTPANRYDGLGWDGTSTAYVETGDQDSGGRSFASRPFMQIITNCTFQHWRGEMVKSVSSYTNGTAYIENCVFRDGNATALNYYPSTLDVGFCTFSNLFQLCEEGFHQFGNSVIHDCLATNVYGNVLVFNGGSLAYRSWLVTRNALYGGGTFSSAANRYWFVIGSSTMQNVSIVSNTIGGVGAYQQAFIQLGYAGGQLDTMFPNNTNDNFTITGNTFLTTDGTNGSWALYLSSGATGYRNANINFSSNHIACGACGGIYESDGPITNVTCSGNVFDGSAKFNSGNEYNSFILVQNNNSYQSPAVGNSGTGAAQMWAYNYGSYGPKLGCYNLQNYSTLVLDDSTNAASKTPLGAVMFIDNTNNVASLPVTVYPSMSGVTLNSGYSSVGNVASVDSSQLHYTVPLGQSMQFNWTGTAWTNSLAGYYALTVIGGTGSGVYTNNQPVTIGTNAPNFTSWFPSTLLASNVATTTFNMPPYNYTITANYTLPPGIMTWAGPTAFTNVWDALHQAGTPIGAEYWADNCGGGCIGANEAVTLTNGSTITFEASNNVAQIVSGGNGQANSTFFTGDTGNANFNYALSCARFDNGPMTIQVNHLTPGQSYTIQMFSLDTRQSPGNRFTQYYNAADTNSHSAAVDISGQNYVLTTFIATNTAQQIIAKLSADNPTGPSGNFNALVVYSNTPPSNTNLLTVVNGSGSGYGTNAQVFTISAYPISGETFTNWSGANIANTNLATTTVTVYSNETVTANYYTNPTVTFFNLTVNSGTGSGSYASNSVASIVANTISGETFTNWTGAGIANTNLATTTVTVVSNMTVTANYFTNSTPVTNYSLTVNSGSGSGTYTNGSTVTIAANTISGETFTNWSGTSIANTNLATTTVNLVSNTVVTANYFTNSTPVTNFSLTVNSGSGSGTYTNGSTVAITASTIVGETFTNWSGTSISNTNSASTSVLLVSNTVVTANYFTNATPPVNFVLTVVNGSGSGSYASNTVATIIANSIGGETFTNWIGQNIANTNLTSTTVTVFSNSTVTANYFTNSTTPPGGGPSTNHSGYLYIPFYRH